MAVLNEQSRLAPDRFMEAVKVSTKTAPPAPSWAELPANWMLPQLACTADAVECMPPPPRAAELFRKKTCPDKVTTLTLSEDSAPPNPVNAELLEKRVQPEKSAVCTCSMQNPPPLAPAREESTDKLKKLACPTLRTSPPPQSSSATLFPSWTSATDTEPAPDTSRPPPTPATRLESRLTLARSRSPAPDTRRAPPSEAVDVHPSAEIPQMTDLPAPTIAIQPAPTSGRPELCSTRC